MSRRSRGAKDDLVELVDDRAEAAPQPASLLPPWRILIVDDDREVHSATLFALKDLIIAGRPLAFLNAYSASEALDLMRQEEDVAVVLLDVVMESGDAGLKLVRAIREELGRPDPRIILRTGQPGYAPELEVIREYDINDYKTKSELTRTRLVTTLTTAIRSYEQIRTVRASERGMDRIVRSAPQMLAQRNLEAFAENALRQMADLLGDEQADGVFCAQRPATGGSVEGAPLYIAAAIGGFGPYRGGELDQVSDEGLLEALECCRRSGDSLHENKGLALCISAGESRGMLYLRTARPLTEFERRLAEVLSVSIATGLENVALFQKLNFFAYYDPLSQLPNRANFVSRIDERLRAGGREWTVAVLDIDHFSDINASLGHQTGDLLLQAVARRLRAGFPDEVVLARVSGDTYGLLGPDALLDPEQILSLFAQPLIVDGQSLIIHPYLGLEKLAEAEGTGSDIFKNAHIALARAKNEHREHWQYFTREMQVATQHRLRLLNDLRHAAETKRGLSLHYQPQIDIATGGVIGAEALMRWTNDRGESIPPARFIPVAEYSRLIIDLGEWVLCSACEQLRAWDRAGHGGLRMSVNVSPAQFRDPNFVGMARRCILGCGIDPGRIELEVTESMALTDSEMVVETLYKMKSFGVSVAVDDFGSGYSSLGHLHKLPLNRLKIDRAFVSDLKAGSSGSTIAGMIVNLGRMLGLAVIAEGVETGEQFDALRDMGCQEVQGYYFSPPVTADAFAALLKKGKR